MSAPIPEELRPAGKTSWRGALMVAVAGLVAWRLIPGRDPGEPDPDAKPRAVEARGDLASDEKATIELFKRDSPGVVYIRSLVAVPTARNPEQVGESSGSGFVWDAAGHIVTNYHVVHASERLEVTLSNHQTCPARVIGSELEKDIAVLAIETANGEFAPLPIGTSADLQVGQKVFAIGNPFGLDQTLTSGLISGLGREMPARFEERERGQHPITDLIQTDAAINKGNSGGPLLDSAGRLIGMNTAIVTESGGYSGVGFAIPIDTINRVVTEILKYGRTRRPGLGIKIASEDLTRAFNVDGVVVAEILAGSAAERAGLRAAPITDRRRAPTGNDVITAINGVRIHNANDLFRELDHHAVGDKITLDVLRTGDDLEIEVELQDLH